MQHRLEFHDDPPIVTVVTSGVAEPTGWDRLHAELLGDPRVQGRALLVDHSNLEVADLTAEAVRTIGRSVRSATKRLGPIRRAVVVTEGFRYGLARMAEGELGPEVEKMVRIFTSSPEAIAWLRGPPD